MNETPPPVQQYPQSQPPQRVQVAMPNAKPYVTYFLIGVTIVVYLLQLAGKYLVPADYSNSLVRLIGISVNALYSFDVVALLGEKINALIRLGQVWRLITPVFLHDSSLPYGLMHIGFNMYALYVLGRGVEARFGHWRFTLLYFLAGYAGNVFSFLLSPAASLGASTAIFGLFAAEGVFVFQNRDLFRDRGRAAISNILSLAAVNLFLGFIIPNVDNWGHLGGILGGILFSWFGGPRWKLERFAPAPQVVDEREGRGALAGALAVLLFFIPLTALGWFWIVK